MPTIKHLTIFRKIQFSKAYWNYLKIFWKFKFHWFIQPIFWVFLNFLFLYKSWNFKLLGAVAIFQSCIFLLSIHIRNKFSVKKISLHLNNLQYKRISLNIQAISEMKNNIVCTFESFRAFILLCVLRNRYSR